MKRLSFLLGAFALVAFISLNACKSSASKEEKEAAVEQMLNDVAKQVEEAVEETVSPVDTTAVAPASAVDTVATEAAEGTEG